MKKMNLFSVAFLAVIFVTSSAFIVQNGDPIYNKVEQMPTLKGCDSKDQNEALKCTYGKLAGIIGDNLKYPEDAKKNKTEGKAFIEFVVNKNGDVVDVVIKKDLENGCGQAALEAVKSMATNNVKWNAGVQDGKKVNVRMILPVMFKLPKEK